MTTRRIPILEVERIDARTITAIPDGVCVRFTTDRCTPDRIAETSERTEEYVVDVRLEVYGAEVPLPEDVAARLINAAHDWLDREDAS